MNLSQFPVFSVSQVNHYVKDLMERDGLLNALLVRGEVSNYKCYPSGHHYFSLKDAQGSIRCVMFRGDAARLRFRPANGMSVVAFGRVSVFPRDGQYQLYCSELIDDGQGALDRAFEELRRRLEAEGLFDGANKLPLPACPGKIALVTSPAGAAVRDMIRILGARWPMARVMVVPVRVQGEEAAGEIAAAIHGLNNRNDIDLIITGRGGGSREDLWAFNEEVVARAIYVSNIPVISAVGHEPDVSISDYVADARASTPSNAAEIAVPDQGEIRARLEHLARRLAAAEGGKLAGARKDLARLEGSRMLRDLKAPIDDRRMLLDHVSRDLAAALERSVKNRRLKLGQLSAGLHAMSPLRVLGRGYAIAKNGSAVVTTVSQVEQDDDIEVMVSDGLVSCRVTKKEERTWQ
ncbi:MAG: exodeoxyribonuclease VII large subunit [Oscillospiraceae bacterium]|nr:exodeoxyribonuclease VII large subunit [Oscillospiraceae bacterium]